MSELSNVRAAPAGISTPPVEAPIDVAIVGAGPAGLAAAARCAAAGARTVVFDEQPQAGGQIYRALGASPWRERRVLGEDYWAGAPLLQTAQSAGARFEHGTTVWSLDETLELGVLRAGAARLVNARQVILATGALERPFPIAGWTLPGVLTVGAAQTLMKTSGAVPTGRVVLAGCGPLLWLYAAQALRAGGSIALLLDTTDRSALTSWDADLWPFLTSGLARKGLALMREVKRQVPVVRGVAELAAEAGSSGAVAKVRWRTAGGHAGSQSLDTLLLHQGVVPNVNLAMAAGVAHQWHAQRLAFEPVLDDMGQSSVAGIAIAGDGAGIAGATAAAARGELAAIGALRRLGRGDDASLLAQAERSARTDLARHTRGREFLDRVFAPLPQMRLPRGDTLVCRCEEVTAQQVNEAVALGCSGPNQLKSLLRCGMGPCQGRLCGLTVTELMAEQLKVSPQQIGHYRLRAPVKPVTLGALAALPSTPEAERAVVRL